MAWLTAMDPTAQETFLSEQGLIPVPQRKPSEHIEQHNKVGGMKMPLIGQWNDEQRDKVR